jgi:hypothetical protein
MKGNIRNSKSKGVSKRRLVSICVGTIVVLVIIASYLYIKTKKNFVPGAAIIDQLGCSQLSGARFENQSLINAVKSLLSERFSRIDYYSDNATIEQYKLLSERGYKLIIWRSHSAIDEDGFVAICSSEQYIQGKYSQYSVEQLTLCNITGEPLFFAITPHFIKECMSGRFEDTVIIFMACNGLNQKYVKTAEAFIGKGVRAFISWDNWIGSLENDQATISLLDNLIMENDSISEAVSKIPTSYTLWGPSQLVYYPHEVADYYIPNFKENNIEYNSFSLVIISLKNRVRRLYRR